MNGSAADAAGRIGSRAREFAWLLRARWGSAFFLLFATVLVGVRRYEEPAAVRRMLLVVAGIAACNLVLVATRWLEAQPTRTTLIVLLFDILALTLYLHYSGDIENPLLFTYCLPVVAGAILLSRRAAFLLAACSLLGLFGLEAFTAVDAVPIHIHHYHLNLMPDLKPQELSDPDLNEEGWNYIFAHMGSLAVVLMGCAFGFGTLAERIQQTNAALEHENQRFALLLNILPEGVVLLGERGSLLLSNPAARRLVSGIDGEGISGTDPLLAIAPRLEGFAGPLEEFETNQRDRILHHTFARGAAASPVVWLIQDLTQQRRLTAQVMHYSKMVDLGLLAAGIAHEIGNPLSSMSAIIDIIEIKQAAPAIVERLRALRSHVDRIHRIVQDITSFARPSAGKRRAVTTESMLDKALQIFRLHEKGRNVRVELHGPSRASTLDVVEDQIVQVVLNLLLNAADAIGGSGSIRMEVVVADTECTVSVVDAGMGMSEDTQRRLFTPFFTTKDPGKGVGLGLFISECIVRDHGGRIDVASAPGRGSTFTVHLPILSPAEARA